MESDKKHSDGFVSCLGDMCVVVSPASSLRRRVTLERSYIQGRQWAATVGLGLRVVGSHKELRRPVLSVKKWDDVSPWGRTWQ